MIHSEREVIETPLVAAMLDRFDTVYLGLNGGEFPYVVPLSFGYALDDEKLEVYVHCSRQGHKLTLLRRDPHVCCTFSAFSNFPRKMYKGHRHDFRSVMAFGTAEILMQEERPKEYAQALTAILHHYDRVPARGENRGFLNFNVKDLPKMYVIRVTCQRADVFAKSECPVRTPEDVPFPPVYDLPDDNQPYDISDLEARPKRPSRFED